MYSTQFWKFGPMASGPVFPLKVTKFSKIMNNFCFLVGFCCCCCWFYCFYSKYKFKKTVWPLECGNFNFQPAFEEEGETSDLTRGQIFDSYEYWRFDGKLIIVLGSHICFCLKSCPARPDLATASVVCTQLFSADACLYDVCEANNSWPEKNL